MAGRKAQKSTHFRSIDCIKHPTMSVWRPFCVNEHTNILLSLAERENEASYIANWLLVGRNNAYKMSLWMAENLQNLHILGVLLG